MSTDTSSRSERIKDEMRKYALISAYLYVCFAVLLLYDTVVTSTSAATPVPWGVAIVKALVLGKFVLIGDALSIGSRANAHPLLHRIVWKSLAMLLLLVVFKCLEEIIVGWVHGHSLGQVLAEFSERSWIQNVAPLLLMLLILIPLLGAMEIYRTVGPDRLKQIMLNK